MLVSFAIRNARVARPCSSAIRGAFSSSARRAISTEAMSSHASGTSISSPLRARMPSWPTVCGRISMAHSSPIIHVSPQIPRMRTAMRTTGHRCTIRSRIGISIADSTMKIHRMVSTERWYENPAVPAGSAGRRATARAMLA
ncbi:hypothetical protein [Microbacterium sp. Root53]|uniref:hypothetical protein n=1 Tax=Microbacterium sp. Root53 TaxID=1736553 RepID=UPI0019103D41|nr:hypothetical protein [Microbacterium sp. Root53]